MRAERCWPGRQCRPVVRRLAGDAATAGRPLALDYAVTRFRYSPVRVSISILSPVAQNSGTLTL